MFIRQISNHTIAHIADNNIELLATVPSLAFGYAQYILNGKFELGEEAISKNSFFSYAYAMYVLNGPFPLGEPAIKNNVERYNSYLRFMKSKQEKT